MWSSSESPVNAQWSVTPPPDMAISPLPRSELPLIVFILVQDTRVSCFPASHEVSAEVSALSALRFAKFVSITDFDSLIAVGSVVIVLIVYSYRGEVQGVQSDIIQ